MVRGALDVSLTVFSKGRPMNFDDLTEHTVIGASGGKEWYALEGLGGNGISTTINFIVASDSEVAGLAQAQCIIHNVTPRGRARKVGSKTDYDDLTG
jgi:hypothetical protein